MKDAECEYPHDENLIVVTIRASISEIKSGKLLPIEYKRSFRCKACNGLQDKTPCEGCKGEGYFTQVERIEAILKEY